MKEIRVKINQAVELLKEAEKNNVPLDDAHKPLIKEIAQANEKSRKQKVKTIMVRKILDTTDNSKENVEKAVDELFENALNWEEDSPSMYILDNKTYTDLKKVTDRHCKMGGTYCFNLKNITKSIQKPVEGYRIKP